MMDDTTDKIRRNLVTLSAFIIAATFLGVNLLESSPWFSETAKRIPPLKFWVVTALVEIYFLLRYHYDDACFEQKLKYEDRYNLFKQRAICTKFEKELRQCISSGKAGKWILSLPEVVGEIRNMKEKNFSELKDLDEIVFGYDSRSEQRFRWSGDIGFTMSHKGIGQVFRVGKVAFYRIPMIRRLFVYVWSTFRTIVISKSTVEWVVPYALAWIALGICGYKMISLLR